MVAGLTILGIAGSLRAASFNRGLLRAAQEVTPEGASIEIYENLGQIPLYNDENGNLTDEQTREFVRQLVEALAQWTRQLQGAGAAPRPAAEAETASPSRQ